MRRTVYGAVAAATALTLVGGGLASADDIANNLDSSVDAVAEVMPLALGGANGTTTLYVTPTGGDGKPGCNLTGSTSVTISLSSSNPAVASVSPNVTFTSCSDRPQVTVTPLSQGSTTISASQTANTTEASFNLAPVTFTVNVAPPPNSPPAVSVGGVAGGASYAKGAVPAASCNVTDKEDGASSFPATLSAITGPHAADGLGSQTASCTYTDGGGLTASSSETYGVVDPSAPIISSELAPTAPDGANGWYKSDVGLSWTVTEAESPNSLVKTGCVDQSVTVDQVATDYSCSAESAGGVAPEQSVTIKRDGTAPTVEYTSASGVVGLEGWHTSDVVAAFTGTDSVSKFGAAATETTTKTASSTGEGSAVSVLSPDFTDNAGNTRPAGAAGRSFKIDLNDPTASLTCPTTVHRGSATATAAWSGEDTTAGSGLVGAASRSKALDTTTVGSKTLIGDAPVDLAGRTGTAPTCTYSVVYESTGILQPINPDGTSNFKLGSTVPVKMKLTGSSAAYASANIGITVAKLSNNAFQGELEVLSTSAADSGSKLRYDLGGDQYIFNLSTKVAPMNATGTYRVTLSLGDGTTRTAQFSIVK